MDDRNIEDWKSKFYDKSFFKKIDNHQKAYWLGYIYADGNVFKKCLSITSCDKEVLEAFKMDIKSEHSIITDDYNSRQNPKNSIAYKISISDTELINYLNLLGIIERKSLILKFPDENQVPNEFINNFMLGYFDGDGSIQIYKSKNNNKWNFSIISTFDFCDKFQKILIKNCNLFDSKLIKYKRLQDKDIWEVHICGVYTDKLDRIYNFLYKDINFCLSRKRNIFLEILKNGKRENFGSKYIGVIKSFNKWQSRIKINKININLGRYDDEIAAAKAYDNYRIKHNMDLRYLNFPNA